MLGPTQPYDPFLSLSTPASAPTSFEGPFGKVLHQVKAVIDTPRFSKDYKCNKIFYILCPLNLNDIPDIEVRTRMSVVGKCQGFGTCPCHTGCLGGWTTLSAYPACARAGQGLLICPALPSVPVSRSFLTLSHVVLKYLGEFSACREVFADSTRCL